MNAAQLKELLENLPAQPGVYLMKNHAGKVVYIGKAKNLRQRVRQYFSAATSDTRFFIPGLAARIATIDTVVTESEKEAVLLEYNLIQRHLPRYNIRLLDDKDFLCIRFDIAVPWPRIEVVRRPRKDKALYFGPYSSAHSARETVRLINRHFKLRSCSDRMFANRVRPCLQYQIHRCFAPCVFDVDAEMYRGQVQDVRLFLEGRRDDLLQRLKDRMQTAADAFDFETAARLRDQIRAVEETLAPQRITEISDTDRDVLALYREGDLVQVVVMEIVAGRTAGIRDYFFAQQEFPSEEILSSFIVQHYSDALRFPDEVLLPFALPDADALTEVLSERRGRKVRVFAPKRGGRIEQLHLASENAAHLFAARKRAEDNAAERLARIQKMLHLSVLPQRIECVDIAHLGGTNTVGAISVVENAQVNPKAGRVYRLKAAGDGNDYDAIREVLHRRFLRATKGETGWEAPDLLVVDGGRGQLGVACAVLDELGLSQQAVVGLAEERSEGDKAEHDRVYLPGRRNPIPVRAETSPLFVLSMARDEAHRLANAVQARSRRKQALLSRLDDIPGVGPKTRKELLRHFGSLKRIAEASESDLVQVPGVGPKLAAQLREHLRDIRTTKN